MFKYFDYSNSYELEQKISELYNSLDESNNHQGLKILDEIYYLESLLEVIQNNEDPEMF
jgi:flagellar biosynthesis/type III secretory pathway chaperone